MSSQSYMYFYFEEFFLLLVSETFFFPTMMDTNACMYVKALAYRLINDSRLTAVKMSYSEKKKKKGIQKIT